MLWEVLGRGYSRDYSRGTIERSRRSIARCLGHSKRLHRGMLGGVLRGELRTTRRALSWYSGCSEGTLAVGGCTLGYPGVYTRARAPAFADLSAAFETDAVQFDLGVNPH